LTPALAGLKVFNQSDRVLGSHEWGDRDVSQLRKVPCDLVPLARGGQALDRFEDRARDRL
jgi:hypothetical protein